MGYTKAERELAAENKIKKQIALEIMKELRELTGESFDTLENFMKDEMQSEHFNMQSKSVLYRELGAKTNNELKIDRLSLLGESEGELRLRLIETPIKYDKQDKALRLLCSYEVKTEYFHYKKIDSNKSITKQFLMEHIEYMQNQHLKIPIASVLLTQRLLDDTQPCITYWNVIDKSEVEHETLKNEKDRLATRIEQKHFPVETNEFVIGIEGLDKKTNVLTILSNATQHHQSIAKKRLRQHQKFLLRNLKSSNKIAVHKEKIFPILGSVPIAGIFGSIIGAGASAIGILGLLSAIPSAYGMPMNIFEDLAEEIEREESENVR